MSKKNEGWRNKEPSYKEVVEKYPDLSPLVILKIDLCRRGVIYTKTALDHVDENIHLCSQEFGEGHIHQSATAPSGFQLRDGSSVVRTDISKTVWEGHRDPYTIDWIDGKFYATDEGKIIEEVFLWEKPDFYNKVTSNGVPMSKIAAARSQRFEIFPPHICQFGNPAKDRCKYCSMFLPNKEDIAYEETQNYLDDITETAIEAFKQKGRFANVMMTAGSIIDGEQVFDKELEKYIQIFKAVGKAFNGKPFPSQAVTSAFSVEQLKRLKAETGLITIDSDIEATTHEWFAWLCPGKEKVLGFDEWKKRIFDAVEVFGRGHVNTGVVAGTELANPDFNLTEEQAIKYVLESAEDFPKHGVSLTLNLWNACKGSILYHQNNPSLDYYVQVARGFAELNKKYGLNIVPDDYRRCGNHINLDFMRV